MNLSRVCLNGHRSESVDDRLDNLVGAKKTLLHAETISKELPKLDYLVTKANAEFEEARARLRRPVDERCLKCGAEIIDSCLACGTPFDLMHWDYTPNKYPYYYKTAECDRDFCPKCKRIRPWALDWLLCGGSSVLTEDCITPYEFSLMQLLVSPNEHGLTLEDVSGLAEVKRSIPFLDLIFGANEVTIEDERHPKSELWKRYRRTCASVLAESRKKWAERHAEKMRRLSSWLALSGQQFEIELCLLLKQKGHRVERRGGPNDKGVDLVIEDGESKIIVQCKAHAKKIGPGPVRDLFGALHHWRATEAWLVGIEGFSTAARQFAQGKPIRLLTISEILE